MTPRDVAPSERGRKKSKKDAIPPHVMRLYKAVAHYVKKNGGMVIVTSGIQIQEWPGDGEYRFTVAVKCNGRKPTIRTKP